MQPLEHLRSQIVFRFLDAVTTAPLRPVRRVPSHLRAICSPRISNYDRAGSFAQLVDTMLPGAGGRASGFLCRPRNLPFKDDHSELLGYGSGATVFTLGKHHVLKVYRRSLGRGPESLLALALDYKAQYERILAWYRGAAEFVPRTDFIVLHGHILGTPAAGCVQAYVGDRRVDLFEELTPEALAESMDRDDGLRREVEAFAERTLELWNDERACVDLLGKGNVVVTHEEGRTRLRLLDCGILDATHARTPLVTDRVEKRMRALEEILRRLRGSA